MNMVVMLCLIEVKSKDPYVPSRDLVFYPLLFKLDDVYCKSGRRKDVFNCIENNFGFWCPFYWELRNISLTSSG